MRHSTKACSKQLSRKKVETAKHSKIPSLFIKYFPQECALSTNCTCKKKNKNKIANGTSVSKSLKNVSLDLWFDSENKSHNAKFTRNILVKGAPISIQNYKIFSGLIV
jgi:hypothetical protein